MATHIDSDAIVLALETLSGQTPSITLGSTNRYLFAAAAWTNSSGGAPTISSFKYGGSGGTDITPGGADSTFYFGAGTATGGGLTGGPTGTTTIYSASGAAFQGAMAGMAYEGVDSAADFTSNTGVTGDVSTVVASVTVPNALTGQTVCGIVFAVCDSFTALDFTAVAGTTIRAQYRHPTDTYLVVACLEAVAASDGSVTLSVNANMTTTGAIGWAAKGVRLVNAAGGGGSSIAAISNYYRMMRSA